MGVGMEETKPHQLLEITGCTHLSHRGRINAGFYQRLTVVDLDAGQVVEAQHTSRAQLPDHTRDPDAFVIQKLLTKTSGVLRLNAEIELTQQHTATFPCHRRPITTTPPTGIALQHSCHLLHHLQIKAKQAIEPRALHLEHHLPATAQAGAMHLGQRGCTQGFGIQIDHLGTARPQLSLEHGLHLIKTEGRNAVLQRCQLGHPARGEDVWAGGEQLPQLDEGGAQRQQLRRQPTGSLLLTAGTTLGGYTAAVGPGLAIPPKQQQQRQDSAPDAERSQQAEHQGRASIAWLRSATVARRRSITACGLSDGSDVDAPSVLTVT